MQATFALMIQKETVQLRDGRMFTLYLEDLQELDLEDILRIDYENIIGELLTFPVIFNRIGVILKDIENLEDTVKTELKMLESNKYVQYKKDLIEDVEHYSSSGKQITKTIFPTDTAISHAVMVDEEVQAKREEYFEVKRQRGIVQEAYWSAKSKDSKLDSLMLKLSPDEIDLIHDKANGIPVKQVEPLIK